MKKHNLKKLLAIIALGAMPFGTASSCDYDGAIGRFLYSDDVSDYAYRPGPVVYYEDDCYYDDCYYDDYYYEEEYYYEDCNPWDGCYWEEIW